MVFNPSTRGGRVICPGLRHFSASLLILVVWYGLVASRRAGGCTLKNASRLVSWFPNRTTFPERVFAVSYFILF